MKRFASAILICLAGSVGAQPHVDSLFGEFRDGNEMQILGRGFGRHPMDIEWTGDWIEAQEEGVNPDRKENWEHLFEGFDQIDSISSVRAWSGSKAIRSAMDRADLKCGRHGCFESCLRYLHPGEFRRIYACWWVYFEPLIVDPKAETQWKFVRVNSNFRGWSKLLNQEVTPVNNIQSDIYWPMYVAPNGNYSRSYVEISCAQNCDDPWHGCMRDALPAVGEKSTDPWTWIQVQSGGSIEQAAPSIGAWCRVELLADSGTMDASDGSLRLRVSKPGQGSFTGFDWTQINFLDSRECRNPAGPWRTLIFQNMFDSNGSEPHIERADIYLDDIYLQFETEARVELGDRPHYGDCTQLEIQLPRQWDEGGIRFAARRGAFASGERLYLFVIDEAGRASAGHPLRLP